MGYITGGSCVVFNKKPIPTVVAGEVLLLRETNSHKTYFIPQRLQLEWRSRVLYPSQICPRSKKIHHQELTGPWQAFPWAIKVGTECACKPNLHKLQSTPAKKLRSKCPVLSGWIQMLSKYIFLKNKTNQETQGKHELAFRSDHIWGAKSTKKNRHLCDHK